MVDTIAIRQFFGFFLNKEDKSRYMVTTVDQCLE